jgi:hypothetical protein
MSKIRQPSRQASAKRRAADSGAIKGSDPPHLSKAALSVDVRYPHTPPALGRQLMRLATDIYGIARHPWIFVIIVLSYLIISASWLIAKMTAFSVLSVIASFFALIYAIAHNLLELVDCLGTISGQVSWAFYRMSRKFRRFGKRLRETLAQAQ